MTEAPSILQIRLEALGANLEQIVGLAETMEAGRADIEKLYDTVVRGEPKTDNPAAPTAVDDVRESLTSLVTDFGFSMSILEKAVRIAHKNPASSPVRMLEEIDTAAVLWRQIEDRVTELQAMVTQLFERSTEVQENRMSKAFRDAPDKPMARLNGLVKKVEQLERKADAGVAAEAAGPGRGGETLASTWTSYEQLYMTELEDLFAGYVEVVGGLALRHVGFDQGLCSMADLLATPWQIIETDLINVVAIPARRRPGRRVTGGVIRLEFPEWTIWALPLAAHEFAQVVLEQRSAAVKELDDALPSSITRAQTRTALADAIAAAVMGPSYACALTLLHLDPCPPAKGGPSFDRLRHAVVLHTLVAQDEQDDARSLWERLERAWDDAIAESSGASPAEAPDRPWTAEAALIYTKMMELLGPNGGKLLYPPSQIRKLEEWDLGGGELPTLSHPQDTRDVLNGAWWQRMQNRRRADAIAGGAKELWIKGLGPSREAGDGGHAVRTGR